MLRFLNVGGLAAKPLLMFARATAWYRAQCDVYSLIGEYLKATVKLKLHPGQEPYLLADVGQRCDRGKVTLDGTCPTCCTQTCRNMI